MTASKFPPLGRTSTAFLQTLLVLIALAALFLLLYEPQLEGRNKHATQFDIYFKDPFLLLVYVGSIPFFTSLYHAFKLLGHAARDTIISQPAVNSLRTIKFCALAVIGFVVVAELVILSHTHEDRAGGVAIGLLLTFLSTTIAAAAATFQRVLQNALDIKSENDLTV